MKEITSAYDDVEKRLAIFLGLGAMIFSSLYLFTQGADLYTYLVRGVLALVIFTAVGWAFGHWLKGVLDKQREDDQQASIRATDTNLNQDSVLAGDVEGAANAVIPAEHSAGKTVDFTLPELEPFGESVPPGANI